MQQTMLKEQRIKGFTLVELLIVVIILAILAAIVVPQFASSTDDAKISSLDTTLSNLRSALDLYYQQHGGRYPGFVAATDGTTTPADDAARIVAMKAQLSLYTNSAGKTQNSKNGTFKYGPYLKKADLPANPVTENSVLVTIAAGTLGITGDAANQGWKYDVVTGQFIANDTTADPNGLGYDKH